MAELTEAPRESFMEAAQREMIAFERKEREFRRQEKFERADLLAMPALKKDNHAEAAVCRLRTPSH